MEDLLSIVNPDIRKPFDMREVMLRIVDDSRLSLFKPKYGPNIITAWAHIMGKTTRKPYSANGHFKLIYVRNAHRYRGKSAIGHQSE
jgi:hypothetical protein